MRVNNRYLIEAPTGFQDFLGVKKSLQRGLRISFLNDYIDCSDEHLILKDGDFVKACSLSIGDIIQGKQIHSITEIGEIEQYDPVEVQGDSTYIQEDLIHHNCLVIDEQAFIKTSVYEEFQDSIFPSQSGLAWTKNIILSTANGQNHFYDIMTGARDGSNGYEPFEIDWREPPRYKKDGTLFTPDEFKTDIIKKHGEVHFNQNYQCSFIGSSMTLLNQETLESLKPTPPEYTRDSKLKVFKDPEPGSRYIMTVDGAKDGSDYFTVNIFNITNFPFEQVQSQRLQVNYLLMPEYLLDWAESYNYAYIIIENNEGQGQSVQDVLYMEYEYANLHFDKRTNTKVRSNKEHPGFRTTKSNRPVLLSTMKSFLEEGKLIIHCQELMEEFKHFMLINNKYQADDGYHDDLIMGTSFLFVPFIDIKNFDGFRGVIDALFDKNSDQDFEFMDSIVFGDFNQGTDSEMETSSRSDEWGGSWEPEFG